MAKISTQFLSYHKIQVDDIDLYEDAFGFYRNSVMCSNFWTG